MCYFYFLSYLLHATEFHSITVLTKWPRGLLLNFAVYAMEPNKSEELGEMYSPDDQGEYVPEVGMLSFSVQGLSDALTALDTEVMEV